MFTMIRSLPVIVAILAGSAYAAEPATPVVPPAGDVTPAVVPVKEGDGSVVVAEPEKTSFVLPGNVRIEADVGTQFVVTRGADGMLLIDLLKGGITVDSPESGTFVRAGGSLVRINDGKLVVDRSPQVLNVFSEGGATFYPANGARRDIGAGRRLILNPAGTLSESAMDGILLDRLTRRLVSPGVLRAGISTVRSDSSFQSQGRLSSGMPDVSQLGPVRSSNGEGGVN